MITNRQLQRTKERAILAALLACALVSVATTAGIIWSLASESVEFFRAVSLTEFFFGTRWGPLIEPRSYGVLPLLLGTLMIAGGALVVALPFGLGSAIYLSEYAPRWVRNIGKPTLEVLAGVPTVVYGYFALTWITPRLLQNIFPSTEVFNAASAAIACGIMIIPTISSLCDDAFQAVPRSLREGAYALSATKFEVATRIVVPSAMSGVLASVLLAFARAIGETMAVALAAGMTPKLTGNPLVSVQTMTAYIVQVSMGDTPAGTIEYRSIFAVGMTLFIITFIINITARRVLRRFRETYE